MEQFGQWFEHFRVQANELSDKVREIVHEGNVRRIIIKDEQGHTFVEIPLTVAAIGAVLAPVLAAVGAIAALVAHFEIVVERTKPAAAPSEPRESPHAEGNAGATEDQVRMAGTVPQHVDPQGTKIEDVAGTGEHDSLGG